MKGKENNGVLRFSGWVSQKLRKLLTPARHFCKRSSSLLPVPYSMCLLPHFGDHHKLWAVEFTPGRHLILSDVFNLDHGMTTLDQVHSGPFRSIQVTRGKVTFSSPHRQGCTRTVSRLARLGALGVHVGAVFAWGPCRDKDLKRQREDMKLNKASGDVSRSQDQF